MRNDQDTTVDNQRRDERLPFGDEVTIRIAAQDIQGPGRNVSAQGVYFTTRGALRVEVQVKGQDLPVQGELVRVESMGDGQLGIAIRFLRGGPQPS